MATAFDESILHSLRRIVRAIDLHSRVLASRHRLTGPQLVCLRNLARTGASSPGELARSVSLSPATITGIVDRLEARALLVRSRTHKDRRRVTIALTPEGERIAAVTPLPLHERFAERLGGMPESDQQRIAAALAEVAGMMEAATPVDVDTTEAEVPHADGMVELFSDGEA